jgi:hypothetical protein
LSSPSDDFAFSKSVVDLSTHVIFPVEEHAFLPTLLRGTVEGPLSVFKDKKTGSSKLYSELYTVGHYSQST